MSKLKKNKRNYLFWFKTLLFYIKVKRSISKKYCLLYIPKKLLLHLVFVFACFLLFFLHLSLLWESFGWFTCITLVIVFFYPLGCNLDLVKRKGAEHTSKYFKMSNLNVCNNWCDVPWSWYVSPNFARSFSISPLFSNYSTMNGISFKILWAKLYQKY